MVKLPKKYSFQAAQGNFLPIGVYLLSLSFKPPTVPDQGDAFCKWDRVQIHVFQAADPFQIRRHSHHRCILPGTGRFKPAAPFRPPQPRTEVIELEEFLFQAWPLTGWRNYTRLPPRRTYRCFKPSRSFQVSAT